MKISIITPIFNGQQTLERMVKSVLTQRHGDWELILVDDCSTDSSYDMAKSLTSHDLRITVYRTSENLGPSAARNMGLRFARGDAITFLDCDDEFYPDYLNNVAYFVTKADVLVFAYDIIDDNEPAMKGVCIPSATRNLLFLRNVSTPLGVAHRRLAEGIQPDFEENLWCLEDWEYWKRLARLGLEFIYLPIKSGLYHVRKGSRSHRPRLTERQRAVFRTNREASHSIYSGESFPSHEVQKRKRVLIVLSQFFLGENSPRGDWLLDFLTIASAASEKLHLFIYCDKHNMNNINIEESLVGIELDYEIEYCVLDGFYGNPPNPLVTAPHDCAALYAIFSNYISQCNPDILIVFQCDFRVDPFVSGMMSIAKQRDITLVYFAGETIISSINSSLQNLDYVVATSQFSRSHHWRTLELNCNVLPPPVWLERVTASQNNERDCLVYFHPSQRNGMNLFFRLARQFADCGYDMLKFLVVEWAGDRAWRRELDFEVGDLDNVYVIDRPKDIRQAWSKAKVLLNPCFEPTQPLSLLLEAMANGVPVITFDIGAATEILGEACIAIAPDPCDARCAAFVATEREFEAWFFATRNLVVEEELCKSLRLKCRDGIGSHEPNVLIDKYISLLDVLCPQPGPPFTPTHIPLPVESKSAE